ncbi:MAG: hypothetical protein J6K45_04245 [Clostridia bacterium]|nr:hypothetical protein [Clostridia bacterium]
MKLAKILNDYWALIFIGILSLIEIVPIKISPIEFFGKKLNRSTNEKIDKLDKKIEDYHQEDAKILISDFVQDIKNGEEKSETQWISMLNFVNEYLDKGWNSKVKQDALFIETEYRKKFLKGRD